MRHQAERLLDHGQEAVGVADQVVGLALADGAGRARLGAAKRAAAKKVAHSESSGATSASSTHAFFWRRARGDGRARAASSAAAAHSAATWAQA